MDFFTYNENSKHQFDDFTQTLLAKLVDAYGKVELREIPESGEWCVRIVVTEGEDQLPLAALGETSFDAAKRLIRICGLVSDVTLTASF